jgi:hypothetical protein
VRVLRNTVENLVSVPRTCVCDRVMSLLVLLRSSGGAYSSQQVLDRKTYFQLLAISL